MCVCLNLQVVRGDKRAARLPRRLNHGCFKKDKKTLFFLWEGVNLFISFFEDFVLNCEWVDVNSLSTYKPDVYMTYLTNLGKKIIEI